MKDIPYPISSFNSIFDFKSKMSHKGQNKSKGSIFSQKVQIMSKGPKYIRWFKIKAQGPNIQVINLFASFNPNLMEFL